MRHYDRPQRNVYETINPTSRFIDMANTILKDYGTTHDPVRGWAGIIKTHAWPQETSGPHYELRMRKKVMKHGGGSTEYTLTHYPATGQEPVRYRVRNGKDIKQIDEYGNPINYDPEYRREVRRSALAILGEAVPQDATNLVKRQFEIEYRNIVGNLILSGLAIKDSDDTVPELTDEALHAAVITSTNEIFSIYDDVIAESEAPHSDLNPDKVRQAVDTRPGPDKTGTDKPITMISVTRSLANSLRGRWKNTIPAGFDTPS